MPLVESALDTDQAAAAFAATSREALLAEAIQVRVRWETPARLKSVVEGPTSTEQDIHAHRIQ